MWNDFCYLLIVAVFMARATSGRWCGRNLGDLIGSFLAGLVLYGLCKVVAMLAIFGEIRTDYWPQCITSTLGLVAAVAVLLRVRYVKDRADADPP